MNLQLAFTKAFKSLQENGLSGLATFLRFQIISVRQKIAYQKWIRRHDTLSPAGRENLRRQAESFSHKPIISIILPVFDIDQRLLCRCIESVRKQIYENWELCIADDCSRSPHIRRVLEQYSKEDDRIKVLFRTENGHISAASNSALEIAGGEFCVLLDHDDELSEHALFYVVREINEFPAVKLIYSDEDLIDEKGRRFGPKFKPDWSRDHFYSGNITTHLSCYRTEILRRIGGFAVGMEGSQDYDLTLRFIEQIDENHIRHIPRILYHWRVIYGSVADDPAAKPYAHDAARRAILEHLERLGKKARVEPIDYLHRVRYELPENLPKVSLILPADEDEDFTNKAVETFRRETDYQNLEIILTAKTSGIAGAAERYNWAVTESSGEILCFADPNLRPLSKDWLSELASFAIQKDVGAVGAKLLYQNETVLHGGLLIGINGSVGIAHHRLPREKNGYLMRAQIINNFSAVSVSCLAVRRELFDSCGGFDADNFPDKFFDVDFCLKLRTEGLRNVFTPYAELIQIDPRKRLHLQKQASDDELNRLKAKWADTFARDPFHNPNLSKRSENFSIADATGAKRTGAQPSRLP